MSSDPTSPLPLLRPMEIGELLDEAFDLYKRNFGLLFGIAALLSVPLNVIVVATPDTSGGRQVVNVLSILAGLVTTGALVHAAMERLLGRPITIAAAYRQGLRRFLRLLSGGIIYGLAAFAGLILLVIPGLIVILWSLLLTPVVMVENRGGIGALERARQIAAGNLWRLFILALGLLLVFFPVWSVVGAAIGVIAGLQAAVPPERTSAGTVLIEAGVMLVVAVIQSAWAPVLSTAQLMMYLDLRMRREAYDLELITASVEARAERARRSVPAGPAAPGAVDA